MFVDVAVLVRANLCAITTDEQGDTGGAEPPAAEDAGPNEQAGNLFACPTADLCYLLLLQLSWQVSS